jgi:hypothetical protein
MSPLGRFADFSYLIHLKIWHEAARLGDAALAIIHWAPTAAAQATIGGGSGPKKGPDDPERHRDQGLEKIES